MSTRSTWLLAIATLLAPLASHAQDAYPTNPIRLLVPSAPGSVTDQSARLLADRLTTALKQTVLIENRPGANGLIAGEIAAKAKPDGYTLLYTYAAAMAVNPWTRRKMPFDPQKDFVPVGRPSSLGGNVLVVSSSLPVHNIKELVAYANAQPNPPSYCSWGIGSGGHLAMESLIAQTGAKLRHIPYKAAVPCSNDVAAGHVTIAFVDAFSSLPHVRSKRIRPIALSGPDRLLAPLDVTPTMTEQGVPFQQASWTALFAPKGTPASIVKRLNEEINRILQSKEEHARFEAIGIRLGAPSSPQELGELLKQDIAAWGVIVKAAGIEPE